MRAEFVAIRLGASGFTARYQAGPGRPRGFGKLLAVPYAGVASVELEHVGAGKPVAVRVRTVDGFVHHFEANGDEARGLSLRVAGLSD